jgi:dTDP-4-dehydrorhamnose reductase
MKVLITGGSGLLGQYLNTELSRSHSILSLYNNNIRNCNEFNSSKADINNHDSLTEIFNSFRPEIVVHTAAISSTHLISQSDSKTIYETNVNAARFIAEMCEKYNSKLIYTSTDLVYAGYRGLMLKEDAKLIPVSLYAETKLMGEVKIKETCDNYIILRVALLYGFGLNKSYNHFHQMYLNLKNGLPVKLFTDQFRTPIELTNAAAVINDLILKNIKNETINLGGKDRVSRFQIGEILCEETGFDENLLVPITMDDINDLPKVEDVSMDTAKLQSYGIVQKDIRTSIKEIIQNQKLK